MKIATVLLAVALYASAVWKKDEHAQNTMAGKHSAPSLHQVTQDIQAAAELRALQYQNSTFVQANAALIELNMESPEDKTLAKILLNHMAKLRKKTAPTLSLDEVLAIRIKQDRDTPEFEECRLLFENVVSDPDANLESTFGTEDDAHFKKKMEDIVTACNSDDHVSHSKNCAHMGRAFSVIYFTFDEAYRQNLDHMCVAVTDDIAVMEDEPECMRLMETTSMEFYKHTGRYVTWPKITSEPEFGTTWMKYCQEEEGESEDDCKVMLDDLQSIEIDTSLSEEKALEHYLHDACPAVGQSLLEHVAGNPRVRTRRGRIHAFYLKAKASHMEKAGRSNDEETLAMLDPSLWKGYNISEAKYNPDGSEYRIFETMLERKVGASSLASESEEFEQVLTGKHSHTPHQHRVEGPTCSDHRVGNSKFLCDRRAYTVGISASVSAVVTLGADASVGAGFAPDSYPCTYSKQHGQCNYEYAAVGIGGRNQYASLCGGATSNVGFGLSVLNGYFDDFDSIAGYSETIGASGGLWIFSVGGGVINCFQGSGFNGGTKWCGAYTEFTLGLSLSPVDFSQMLCHAWKMSDDCYVYHNMNDCGGGCFPADSTVTTPNGPVFMKDVRVGDKVLTTTKSGDVVYEPVTFFGHADGSVNSKMTHISLDQSHTPLRLSPKHFVVLCPENSKPCDYHEHTHKYSKDVQVNDYLWVASEGALALSKVVKVSEEVEQGLFNPYTISGNVIVDGVLASAHSDWFLDDYVPASLVKHLPAIYDVILSPGWILYYLTGDAVATAMDMNSPMIHTHGYGNEFISVLAISLAAVVGLGIHGLKNHV